MIVRKVHMKSCCCQALFNFIAKEVAKFVLAHPENGNGELPKQKKLGFTLSYPVDQAVALSGSAIKWKSFSADDPVEFVCPPSSSSCTCIFFFFFCTRNIHIISKQ